MVSNESQLQDQQPRNSKEQSPNLRADFLASVVVFLVALPLCMGIAIASGAPVAAGLITGIIGGIVVGFLAGSPLQVSGPAAGLTVIIYAFVAEYGLPWLGPVVLLAGFLQLTAGLLRLGQWFRAVSPAVIQGMLAGIGFLILASQFHVMVDDQPKGSGLENLVTIPQAITKGLPLPDWNSSQQRKFLRNQLQLLGTLHSEQEKIQERVAEVVVDSPTAEQTALAAEKLQDQVAAQRKVSQQVSEFAESWEKSEMAASLPQFEPRSQLAEEAQRKTAAALAALEAGKLDQAKASQKAAEEALTNSRNSLKNHDWAAKVGILTIAVILLWQFTPSKCRVIPGSLVAVVAATLFAYYLALPVLYVEVPDSLLADVHPPWRISWEVWKTAPWKAILQAGLVVAVIASAETLLCATAVDQMHSGQRTQYDKELSAQGVGNMVCGVLGALPMTGVIVRSAANVQAGSTSRRSAILHGVWLLVFVAGLAFVLRLIPTAALAAILVYTGYKLINPKSILKLRKYGLSEVFIYAATVITIVVEDLLTGVLVGVALSGLKLLYTFSHLEAEQELGVEPSGHPRVTLHLRGAATFIRLPVLAAALERTPDDAHLVVKFDDLSYIDHACLNLLENWERQHAATGGTLDIDWHSLTSRYHTPQAKNGSKATALQDNQNQSQAAENHPSEAAEQQSHSLKAPQDGQQTQSKAQDVTA